MFRDSWLDLRTEGRARCNPLGERSEFVCWLEVEADFSGQRAWRNVVRAAERGQEIVEYVVVGYVDHRQTRAPFVAVAAGAEYIVIAEGYVEQVALLDARRVVVIVFLVWGRHRNSAPR